MGTKLVTAPATQLVQTPEMKDFLRVSGSSEDAIIDSFINAAIAFVERNTNRKLISQTWDYVINSFPSRGGQEPWWDGVREGHRQTVLGQADHLTLPFGPVQSVVSLKTFDQDNNESTFDGSNYFLDDTSSAPRIILNDGATWPTDLRTKNAVRVQAIYGYGSSESQVPADLTLAVKIVASIMYETRGTCKDEELLTGTVKSLINNHKIYVISDVQV